MKPYHLFLFTLLGLGIFSAAHAQTYRWTDPATGKTIFSDTPPPANAKGLTKTTRTVTPQEGMSYATAKAAENFPVVLFTSPDCAEACREARDYLTKRAVPFTEKMLGKQPADLDELKKLVGDAFVPSVRIGKQGIRGFEINAYSNVLDLAGYPKENSASAKRLTVNPTQ